MKRVGKSDALLTQFMPDPLRPPPGTPRELGGNRTQSPKAKENGSLRSPSPLLLLNASQMHPTTIPPSHPSGSFHYLLGDGILRANDAKLTSIGRLIMFKQIYRLLIYS
ncbi:hypothetical protein CEXT_161391 [Caerostris extrusa]|uniref:Uncharacterized protein n=1 Tax=Caerostris extrusa TaxID=172846 RepID=A0AAV4P1W7_CAEEX|nr:hypothetical protein CEXT_161391 [Caerostris extrusa]